VCRRASVSPLNDMPCANAMCRSAVAASELKKLAKSRRSRVFSMAYWVTLALCCLERRRQRKALLELDDRMLADIGITKSQAIDEGKKPFWK
jgi:uncharacterized protein YjiS (DUF1127 family)